MDYDIMVKNSLGKWELVASFMNGIDRDDCMSFLAERYDDCQFKAIDKDE